MNETFSSIEFNKNTTSPSEVLETVAREGAAAVHDCFVPNHLRRSARTLEVADWWTDVEDADDTVHRRHDLTRYGFSSDYPWPVSSAGAGFPPEPIFTAARRISEFVNEGTDISWRPNEIIGHRYEAGDFIARHRDYARALGFVAVLTLEGSQRFSFERDTGDVADVHMQPGTLTIMRGYQPETRAPRPYHWVEPASERRLAISLRQMRLDWE